MRINVRTDKPARLMAEKRIPRRNQGLKRTPSLWRQVRNTTV